MAQDQVCVYLLANAILTRMLWNTCTLDETACSIQIAAVAAGFGGVDGHHRHHHDAKKVRPSFHRSTLPAGNNKTDNW